MDGVAVNCPVRALNATSVEINTGVCTSGVYLLEIQTNVGVLVTKVVVR
jgi:hypothetical protein